MACSSPSYQSAWAAAAGSPAVIERLRVARARGGAASVSWGGRGAAQDWSPPLTRPIATGTSNSWRSVGPARAAGRVAYSGKLGRSGIAATAPRADGPQKPQCRISSVGTGATVAGSSYTVGLCGSSSLIANVRVVRITPTGHVLTRPRPRGATSGQDPHLPGRGEPA